MFWVDLGRVRFRRVCGSAAFAAAERLPGHMGLLTQELDELGFAHLAEDHY